MREQRNFGENSDDVGEIWFGEDALMKTADCVERICEDFFGGDAQNVAVLDVGTGNAATLVELWERGFRRLCGSDYSVPGVQHALNVVTAKCVPEEDGEIAPEIVQDDITDTQLHMNSYDVITDKGTYDAITLFPGTPEERAEKLRRYRVSVHGLLRKSEGSRFVITTCNYTEAEITDVFSDLFEFDFAVPYPVFEFGGHKGATNATVCLIPK